MAEEYERVCLECGLEPLAGVLAAFSSAQLSGEFLCRGSPSTPRLTDAHCPALAAGLIASGVSVAVLSNHSIGDVGMEALFSGGGEWPALTSLNLSENDIGVVGAASLARALPGACPNLQELILDACPLGEAGGCALATLVESHPGLSILRVVRCDLGMDALIALTNSLSRTASLNVLDISEPLLFSRNEETSGHIARALVGNVSLVRLAMRKHKFATDTTTEWLCDALLDNAVLRELDLGGCALGPPSGVHLQKALAAGANLGVLQLAGCRLGDEGACALASVLGGGGRGGGGVLLETPGLEKKQHWGCGHRGTHDGTGAPFLPPSTASPGWESWVGPGGSRGRGHQCRRQQWRGAHCHGLGVQHRGWGGTDRRDRRMRGGGGGDRVHKYTAHVLATPPFFSDPGVALLFCF